MGKVRIFSLAKQLGLRSEALVAALTELGVPGVTPATAIDEETANAARELLAEQARQARQTAEAERAAAAAAAAAATAVAVAPPPAPEAVAEPAEDTVAPEPAETEVAAPARPGAVAEPAISEPEIDTKEDKATEKYFRRRGPSRLDEEDGMAELRRQIAEEEAREEAERARRARAGEVVPLPEVARRPSGPKPPGAVEVPPVVTVLGHVDHGKTTLLDAIRRTNVAAGESGGITQSIGASEVTVGERKIVFLDTPGHEAFTAMRARGAMVTDIAVLVVAADDGIMPQTVEAINHAKAANVPIIVAVNKIDLPDAKPDYVKQQLLEYGLVPEEWGGETIVVPVSAVRGDGLDNLLEMILLVAEVQELWADPNADMVGIVVESSVDPSQGTVCTVLVRSGVLHVGDSVVCGPAYGRVRRLRNWLGESVPEMGPGLPVEVIGLTGVPEAGEIMVAARNPKEARQMAEQNAEAARQAELTGAAGVHLRDLFREEGGGGAVLNVVIKADTWGSAQALESKLMQLDRRLENLEINVVSSGVGEISESDVMLARASGAIVIGFRTGADSGVRQTAESEGVEIRTYEVIYEALEDINKALLGLLEPTYEPVLLGRADVLELFKVTRVGVIAGCRVTDGRMERGAEMRVLRRGQEVWRGTLESLRHYNDDVRVVEAPNECGISTRAFRGWEVGDQIEAWGRVEVERQLTFRDEPASGS